MNPADPLSELRDIHLPDPVPWQWAPGWWLLLILSLLLALAALSYAIWRYRQLAFRREALALISELQAQSDLPAQQRLQAISSLLKRVAISRHGREQAAGLTGQAWLAFLDKTGKTDAFTQGAGRALGDALYRPDTEPDIEALLTLSLRWIRRQ